MTEPDVCPDCGRPKAGTDTGLLETHCFASRKYDWLGERMCRDNTIAKLRTELEALRAAPVYPDTRSVWLLSIVEFGIPLEPGCKIGKDNSEVYEVRKLACKSSPIGGEPRDLFVALHSGPGSALVFICLDGHQREWPAAAPVPTASPWVSVEERMPDRLTPVLVAGGCAYFDGDDWHSMMEPDHRAIQWTITHWMPLPTPPIERTPAPHETEK